MPYPNIAWILEQEPREDFQPTHHRWRPRRLFFKRQIHILLTDMRAKYANLKLAEPELQTLEQAPKYIACLKRMRLWIRQASFVWQSDQLTFLEAVAGFYFDYGVVLRQLKIDQNRGKFLERSVNTQGV